MERGRQGGIRVLRCPVCDIPLCRITYEGVTVSLCPDCRGALVHDARLATIKRRRDRRWSARERRALAEAALAADQRGRVECPRCLGPMAKTAVHLGSSGKAFHLDHCRACNVYWFDRGELALAQMIYEGERNGRAEGDLGRAERSVRAQIEFEARVREFADSAQGVALPIVGASSVTLGHALGAFAAAEAVSLALRAAEEAASQVQEGLAAPTREKRRAAYKRAAAMAIILAIIVAAVCVVFRVSQVLLEVESSFEGVAPRLDP